MTLETTRAREATEHVDDSSDRPHKIGERIRNEIARIPITADFRWIQTYLSAGSADTPHYFLTDAEVVGKEVFLVGFIGLMTGTSPWTGGTMTKVSIMNNSGTRSFIEIPRDALLDAAQFYPGAPGVIMLDAFTYRYGSSIGKGLKLVANGTATGGSDISITALVKIE